MPREDSTPEFSIKFGQIENVGTLQFAWAKMSRQRISNNSLFCLLVASTIGFVGVASYLLLVHSQGRLFGMSRDKGNKEHDSPLPEDYDYYGQDFLSDLELLVATITSKLDDTPRIVPKEEDVIKLAPDLFSALRHEFLSHVKSPCWYEEFSGSQVAGLYDNNVYKDLFDNVRRFFKRMEPDYQDHLQTIDGKLYRMRCLPYFYIIGQPKCGTTDLFKRLYNHPEINFNILKEPHWWTWRGLGQGFIHGDRMLENIPLQDYVDLYDWAARNIQIQMEKLKSGDSAALNIVTGEASTSILWNDQVWTYFFNSTKEAEPNVITGDFLRVIQPNARFIAIFRDPVERLYSEYLYTTAANKTVHGFHDKVVESVWMFQGCLAEKAFRWCVYDSHFNYLMPVKLNVGMYVVFLLDWLTIFPKEQFLILRTEDYAEHLEEGLEKVFTFLGVAGLTPLQRSQVFDHPVSNARKEEDKLLGNMRPDTREILNDFYWPFNQKLASVLNDPAFLWEDTKDTGA